MKFIVTGASGFIGGALMRRLQQEGHIVLGLGRRRLAGPDYQVCDLSRAISLDFRPDVVVHAAARSSPWGKLAEFRTQNVTATRNLLTFCEAVGRPHFVHISTSAVMYTREHQLELDETTPLPDTPINTYAATKRESELLVQSYQGRWCILRPRAVFGPGDTVVFPRILRAARKGRLPFIESDRPVLGDLICIDTLVDYLLRASTQRAEGLYLVTNNQPVAILDFLGGVFAKLGLPAPQRRVPVKRAMVAAALVEKFYACLPFLGEPPITRFGVSVFAYSKTFNVSKALRDLGPPSTTLPEGVDRFVRWQLEQWMNTGETP